MGSAARSDQTALFTSSPMPSEYPPKPMLGDEPLALWRKMLAMWNGSTVIGLRVYATAHAQCHSGTGYCACTVWHRSGYCRMGSGDRPARALPAAASRV